jgi:hypothetical protein
METRFSLRANYVGDGSSDVTMDLGQDPDGGFAGLNRSIYFEREAMYTARTVVLRRVLLNTVNWCWAQSNTLLNTTFCLCRRVVFTVAFFST